MRTVIIGVLALGLLAVAPASSAWAGSCGQMQAELASLGSTRRSEMPRQRAEAARLRSYSREVGCESGGFGFFGRPQECGAISQRLVSLDGRNAQRDSRAAAEQADSDRRRVELRAAIARDCGTETAERDRLRAGSRRGMGGSRLVCVRTCDGFFFPLSTRPGGDGTPAELCRASCPNAEAVVFRAPRDGDIEQAVSERGKPYTQLANASRYQTVHDPSCSCKAKGQTWAQVLRDAEAMLARHKGDVIVTAAKAEELARSKVADVGPDQVSTGSVKRRRRR